jgi:hypothetical protein
MPRKRETAVVDLASYCWGEGGVNSRESFLGNFRAIRTSIAEIVFLDILECGIRAEY